MNHFTTYEQKSHPFATLWQHKEKPTHETDIFSLGGREEDGVVPICGHDALPPCVNTTSNDFHLGAKH